MNFFEKFFLKGFVSGDYTYKTTHIIVLVLLILSCIILPIVFKNKREKAVKFNRIIGIIMISIYIIRRICVIISSKNIWDFYPFYLCNISTIVCFIVSLRGKYSKFADFCLINGIIGGILTFAMPQGIFTDKYLTVHILDSVISHVGIILIPLVAWSAGLHRIHIKNIWINMIGLALVVFNVEVIQRVFFHRHIDYLFLGESCPIKIPGIPSFLVMGVLYSLTLVIIYLIPTLLSKKSKVN